MKTERNINLYLLLVGCSLALLGCGKKVDENQPMSEIKAEAEQMSVKELRAMAMRYKESISAKSAELDKVVRKLKDIPIAERLGTEAEELTAEMKNLTKSLSALRERFQVYYGELKEKGGDVAALEI